MQKVLSVRVDLQWEQFEDEVDFEEAVDETLTHLIGIRLGENEAISLLPAAAWFLESTSILRSK